MSVVSARIRGALRSLRRSILRATCKHEEMADSRMFSRKATCLRCGYRVPW